MAKKFFTDESLKTFVDEVKAYTDTALSTNAGKITTGTSYTIDDETVTAGTGAEVFNDYENNKASGDFSHAEGFYTTASGLYSHAQGASTTASGNFSHAEGADTTASGFVSHAEGVDTTASGNFSHAEGAHTIAAGKAQHVQGEYNIEDVDGTYAHIVGNGTSEVSSNAHTLDWNGNAWFAGDVYVGGTSQDDGTKLVRVSDSVGKKVDGQTFTVDGYTMEAEFGAEIFNNYDSNVAIQSYAHAEGNFTKAVGNASHAEGYHTTASGSESHAEGHGAKAIGASSHAEGNYTEASGTSSHAEGEETVASESCAHAEGYSTTASGYASHAEGYDTTASGSDSHAEGMNTTASGYYSHAEGQGTTASEEGAHSEGWNTLASGWYSHAEGSNTIAASDEQHVQGRYNIEDSNGTYAHIVGNGTSEVSSNAHTLDWEGNAWYQGTIKVGGSSYDDADEVALKSDVSEQISALEDKYFEETTSVSKNAGVYFYTEELVYPIAFQIDNFKSSGESLSITWDLDVDGLESMTFDGYYCYKMSDESISYNDLINGFSFTMESEMLGDTSVIEVTPDTLNKYVTYDSANGLIKIDNGSTDTPYIIIQEELSNVSSRLKEECLPEAIKIGKARLTYDDTNACIVVSFDE